MKARARVKRLGAAVAVLLVLVLAQAPALAPQQNHWSVPQPFP